MGERAFGTHLQLFKLISSRNLCRFCVVKNWHSNKFDVRDNAGDATNVVERNV